MRMDKIESIWVHGLHVPPDGKGAHQDIQKW